MGTEGLETKSNQMLSDKENEILMDYINYLESKGLIDSNGHIEKICQPIYLSKLVELEKMNKSDNKLEIIGDLKDFFNKNFEPFAYLINDNPAYNDLRTFIDAYYNPLDIVAQFKMSKGGKALFKIAKIKKFEGLFEHNLILKMDELYFQIKDTLKYYMDNLILHYKLSYHILYEKGLYEEGTINNALQTQKEIEKKDSENRLTSNEEVINNDSINQNNNSNKIGLHTVGGHTLQESSLPKENLLENIKLLEASLYDEEGNLYDVSLFGGGSGDRVNKLNLLDKYKKDYNNNDEPNALSSIKKVYGSELTDIMKLEIEEKKKQKQQQLLMIKGQPMLFNTEYACIQYEDGSYHDCYVYGYDEIKECQYISYLDQTNGKIMYAPIKKENGQLLKIEHTQELINKIAQHQSQKFEKQGNFDGIDITVLPSVINNSKCFEKIAFAMNAPSSPPNGPDNTSTVAASINNSDDNYYLKNSTKNNKPKTKDNEIVELVNIVISNNAKIAELYAQLKQLEQSNIDVQQEINNVESMRGQML